MIFQISGRTDVVAYYTDWLMERLQAGFCYVRNPICPSIVYRYDLQPQSVDALIFCSKNYKPILKHMPKIMQDYNVVCHYTITAYGKDLEPYVPSIDESIETLIYLSKLIGKERVIWRFDPVLFTEKYTAYYLLEKFEYILQKIAPYIQRIIFSFVEEYAKVKRNMPELISFSDADKIFLVQELKRIADKYKCILQTCGMKENYEAYGVYSSGCTTPEILYEATKERFKYAKGSSKRVGCGCLPTRDIAAYDTCPHGCKYCYANQNSSRVTKTMKLHDPQNPIFIGEVLVTDTIKEVPSISFKDTRQTIFDI